jgi:hypothetical protein
MSTAEVNLAYGDNRVNDQLIDLINVTRRNFRAIRIDDGDEIFICKREQYNNDDGNCHLSGSDPYDWNAIIDLDSGHILMIVGDKEVVNDYYYTMSPEPYGEGLYGYDFYIRSLYTCMHFKTVTEVDRKEYIKRERESLCTCSNNDIYRVPTRYGAL